MLKKTSIVVFALALVAGAGFSGMFARAASTITAPATANISSDSATGASVALPILSVTEGASGDIHTGSLTWALPSGFMFDMTSVANVSLTGTGLGGSAVVSFPDATHFSLSITSTSSAAGTLTIGSATPLKVKAAAGTPLASGNIIMTAGSINGISSSTNFGTLTQVPGAANKLNFATQPPMTAGVGSAFSTQVGVADQFGNVVAADNGRSVSIFSNLISGTAGTLNGTTTLSDISGLTMFNNLSFSQPATITLTAQSASLASSTSNQIVVSANPTPTSTPVVLANGTLVQLEGNPNIFIVRNGKLKLFQQVKKEDDDAMENENDNEDQGSGNKGPGSQNSNDGSDHKSTIIVTPPVVSAAITTNSAVANSTNTSNSSQNNNSRGEGHDGGGNDNRGGSSNGSKSGKGRD